MRPLLNKTARPFLIYVLIILITSIPVYYWVIDQIWKAELDEHNKNIAQKTAFEFNRLRLSDAELEKSIILWNRIQPESGIREMSANQSGEDIYATFEKTIRNKSASETERYRCLTTMIRLNDRPFIFTVRTNIEETEETMGIIALTTAFFFIIIMLGLLLLNRRLSVSIWKPFRHTLEKLKNFNLNHQQNLAFEKTDTVEFEELHQSLQTLIEQNIAAYRTQKEFTENASHELQTPLAIIKQKLDLLLQNEDLTEAQYGIAEDMNKALIRSARINKNLLLLAKIDNSQFDKSETMAIDVLTRQSIDLLTEHFSRKSIRIQADIRPHVYIGGNMDLAEILISNLLVNAIRYTPEYGHVSIVITEASLQISNSGSAAIDRYLLFKRFSGNSSRSGTGLGLAIIKEICHFHGWSIDYRFENGNHVFIIRFRISG